MFCCCAQEADKSAETIKIFDGELTTGENSVGIVQTQAARNSALDRKKEEDRQAEEEQARVKAEEERARAKAEEEKAAEEAARAQEQKIREAEEANKGGSVANIVVATPLQFQVSLKKGTKTTPVGLELDTAGGTCAMVTKIVDGVVQTYNKTATEEKKICIGDVIMQVNQAVGDTKTMGQQAMQATNLDLTIKRPVEFHIQIDKTEAPGVLGIDFEYLAVGRSLLIKSVKAGLVKKWNAAFPNLEVRRFDRITGVNGFVGESEKMLEMMKEADKLDLTIARIVTDEEFKVEESKVTPNIAP